MNIKASMLESCVTSFIKGLLKLLGIDDDPSYQRDTIVNKNEEIQNILQAADYLSDEYMTKKLLTILGDIDAVEDVMKQRLVEDTERFAKENNETPENEEAEAVPEAENVEE